jgi:branched-chain amino acid transport system substrate-binding protein
MSKSAGGFRIAIVSLVLALAAFGLGAQQNTVKIGAILAVTGPASNLGAPEAKTLQMLVEQTNAAGGLLGRKVQLVLKDSGASPEKALSFARQLIEEDQVLAILGPSTSGESLKIKDVAEEGRTILLSCAAAEAIVNPVAKWVFKTPQNDAFATLWIYRYLKERGLTRIGVVASNTGFGNGGMAQLEKYAPENGIQILIAEAYDKDATDLSSVLTKLKARDVQAVVNWSIEPAQSLVAKNMRQLGMKQPLLQSHGFGNIRYVQAAGQAAEGIVFPCGRLLIAEELPDSHPQKALLLNYKKQYESRFDEEVSTFGGHAYDAYTILAEAVRRAGSVEPAKVRDAIENLKGFAGTAGVFNFSPTDHNGLDMSSFEMLTVKDGKFALLKEP